MLNKLDLINGLSFFSLTLSLIEIKQELLLGVAVTSIVLNLKKIFSKNKNE